MTRAVSARDGRASGDRSADTWVSALQTYYANSERPLTILLFLLPMLILYEVGTLYFASDWVRQSEVRVLAFTLMRHFMELFGATGRYLPPLAVAGILIASHIARRDRWELQVSTASAMAVESALLALPLLALGSVLRHYLPLYATDPGVRSGFVLALGAGIYEELVFRLIAFTLLNILLIDLLKIKKLPAFIFIVTSTAITFAAYHYWSPQSAPFRWSDFVFRTASGMYFGGLFIFRGFGITAGAHASYDIYYFALRALTGS